MKICFNLFPPANKLIAILVGMLLLLSYAKLKAGDTGHNTNHIKTITLKK